MNVDQVEVTNRKPTWKEYRLLLRLSKQFDVSLAHELILSRASISEEELDAADLREGIRLFQRVAEEMGRAIFLHRLDLDWGRIPETGDNSD